MALGCTSNTLPQPPSSGPTSHFPTPILSAAAERVANSTGCKVQGEGGREEGGREGGRDIVALHNARLC